MKNIEKKLFILVILIIILVFQWYFVEKPQRDRDDADGKKIELIRVIDGDTLSAKVLNREEKIRLIGIDAPESVKPNSPVECFGPEASSYLKKILEGKDLFFVQDSSQGYRDKYDRLLGYIFVDNQNIAEIMISDGYVYEYTYNNPYRYQRDFKKAERQARRNEHGFWADGICL